MPHSERGPKMRLRQRAARNKTENAREREPIRRPRTRAFAATAIENGGVCVCVCGGGGGAAAANNTVAVNQGRRQRRTPGGK